MVYDEFMRYVALDFEFGNDTKGSICAYGLAFEDGSKEHGFVRLHESAPKQEHTRFHGITQEETDGGMAFNELYHRLAIISQEMETVFVAHNLKSDRRAWLAAIALHGLPRLPLQWLNSIPIAEAELKAAGAPVRPGIATMAARYGMDISHHNPADDAAVALQVVLRNPRSNNIVRD